MLPVGLIVPLDGLELTLGATAAAAIIFTLSQAALVRKRIESRVVQRQASGLYGRTRTLLTDRDVFGALLLLRLMLLLLLEGLQAFLAGLTVVGPSLFDDTSCFQLALLIFGEISGALNLVDGLQHRHFLLIGQLLLIGLAFDLIVAHDLSAVDLVVPEDVRVFRPLADVVLEGGVLLRGVRLLVVIFAVIEQRHRRVSFIFNTINCLSSLTRR